ncbi:MAG: tyrosine-type recombinase/integrase [Butyrivibrio sp.]|nr:tyrosine-type recombinase/integrase [Butyrivibrio sp.]
MTEQIKEFVFYLSNIKKTSRNTVQSYERDLNSLKEFLEKRDIYEVLDITEDVLTEYIAGLTDQHFSASTVSRHISSIKAFYRYMIENGDVSEDPSEILKAPKIYRHEPRLLSMTEINTLLDMPDVETVKGQRDKTMLELLYATGMKVSELISLNVDDVDLGISCVKCKATRKPRIIPYGAKASEQLMVYLSETRKELVDDDENTLLFVNYQGLGMSRQGFWKMVKGYARKAGINEDITPYSLRHSMAVHFMENGADIEMLQEMLGHSEKYTTQRYVQKKTNSFREMYDKANTRG